MHLDTIIAKAIGNTLYSLLVSWVIYKTHPAYEHLQGFSPGEFFKLYGIIVLITISIVLPLAYMIAGYREPRFIHYMLLGVSIGTICSLVLVLLVKFTSCCSTIPVSEQIELIFLYSFGTVLFAWIMLNIT